MRHLRATALIGLLTIAVSAVWLDTHSAAADDAVIAIAEIKRDTPVDFEREVLPLLKKNCVACHNTTKAESSLVLETPQTIIKGGDSGPAVTPKNGAESLLLARATGQDGLMPPPDNKVAAKPFTPEELGLIKLWIDQGAAGIVTGHAGDIHWQPLPPGVNPIYAVAVTPDGQFAACGRANQVFIYHLPTGRFVSKLTDPELLKSGVYQQPGVADLDLIQSLAFSPDGSMLASGGYRSIKLWQRPRDPRVATLDTAAADNTQVVAASADGKWLATAAADNSIKLWDLATGQVARALAGHTGPVTALRFSADGTKLVSGSADKSVRVWQVADGAVAGRLDTPQPVQAVAIAGNGQLITGGGDNVLRAWTMPAGPAKAVAGLTQPVTAVAMSPDRKLLVLACADGPIHLVDTATWQVAKSLAGHAGAVNSLRFQTGGARLVSGGADKTLRVWDVATAQPVIKVDVPAAVEAVAIHPNGMQAATGAADGSIAVWKLAEPPALERPIMGHTGRISSLVYSNDGSLIFSASADGSLRAFQSADGAQRHAAQVGSPVHDLAISPDGQWVATAGEDKLVKVWNANGLGPAGKPQFGGFSGPVRSVSFSPDNQQVIGGGAAGSETIVFNLASGEAVQAGGEQAGPIVGVATAGEKGEWIVSASADKGVRVWPLLAVRQIPGHSQPVTALASLPTAPNQILSGSGDGSVRLWNLDNGQQMQAMNYGAAVSSVAVRPDGQRIAAAGASNVVRLWNGQNYQQVAEVKGDYRSQFQAAEFERAVAARKNEVNAEVAAVTAAENAAKAEAENVKKSVDAVAAAEKALAEKTPPAKQAMDAKVAADKVAADAGAAAKTADADKAAKVKAVADADAANKAAVEAVAKAQAALNAEANNQDLVKAKQAADQAAADAAAKLKAAQEAMAAADKAAAEAAAKLKAATDDLAAKTKAFDEAENARKAAETAKQAADKAVESAKAAAKRADDAVPLAKQTKEASDARLKETETALEAAKKTSTASELPFKTVAFSADNLELAAGGDDKLVHTFSAETGTPGEVYGGQSGAVLAVTYAGANRLVAASADKSAVVFNTLADWSLARVIGSGPTSPLMDRVTALDFSPDGKLLASGGGDPSRAGELKIWNVADGAIVRDLPEAHSDTVLGLDFSPDGKLLASSAADKFIKVFEVGTGKFVRSFEGHTHHVLGVRWRADGKMLASGGADNVVKIWDFTSGDQLRTVQGIGKEVTSVNFVGSTSMVLISSGDKTVRLYNADNGQQARNYGGGTDFMYSAATTPDGKLHLGGGQDSVLREWNGENGQEIRKFEPPAAAPREQAAK
jgi:WD40 repeat protein